MNARQPTSASVSPAAPAELGVGSLTQADVRDPELVRILEAEREARSLVEAAEGEARAIDDAAQRRAAERLDAARAASAERRESARAERIEGAAREAARIRAEARADCERTTALAERRRDEAVEAVLATLLGRS